MADLDAFHDALVNDGFEIQRVVRHPQAFGSWLIALRTPPNTDVIWDGKEGWLIVRRDNTDAWIARSADQATPSELIAWLRVYS